MYDRLVSCSGVNLTVLAQLFLPSLSFSVMSVCELGNDNSMCSCSIKQASKKQWGKHREETLPSPERNRIGGCVCSLRKAGSMRHGQLIFDFLQEIERVRYTYRLPFRGVN